jgi:UDP-N-acetylmuramoyl-L-alanyl-D-glutamate--2,6-diaminopimelate ligase
MKLLELLAPLSVSAVRGSKDVEVEGVAVDSRRVRPGFVFVALEGQKADGHRFVADAVGRGAAAVVSERAPDPELAKETALLTWVQTSDARRAVGLMAAKAWHEPAKRMDLVGVTGTNGKTTTAYLLYGLLSRLASPCAMLGTVAARIAGREVPTHHTTPEAPEFQEFLAQAVAAGCRYGALEVSSHGLALSRLEGSEFEVAVFTNLSRDHLDFHHDMESYFEAKRLLFDRYLRPSGTAVIGIDDSYGQRLAAGISNAIRTFGFAPSADLSLTDVETNLSGTRVQFREDGALREIRSGLIGRYNASNLVGVYAAARALGFSSDPILSTLPDVPGAPGRFEMVPVPREFGVVVDYAHTDDALRKLLEAARPLTRGQLWVVFGCGGERDRTKRPLMGMVAARLADRVVLTSDNPRGEDPEAIVREIQLGTKDHEEIIDVEVDRRKAIAFALDRAKPGDLVVIAGKGHEPYQIVGSQVLDFDDRQVVKEILGS